MVESFNCAKWLLEAPACGRVESGRYALRSATAMQYLVMTAMSAAHDTMISGPQCRINLAAA